MVGGLVVGLMAVGLTVASDAAQRTFHAVVARWPYAPPPGFTSGVLIAGSPGAGELFPQPWAKAGGETLRLDDVLGDGAWLISRAGADPVLSKFGIRAIAIGDPTLAPFRDALTEWLDKRHADAVLVRPDRYVFGSGEPSKLVTAFAQHVEAADSRAIS